MALATLIIFTILAIIFIGICTVIAGAMLSILNIITIYICNILGITTIEELIESGKLHEDAFKDE